MTSSSHILSWLPVGLLGFGLAASAGAAQDGSRVDQLSAEQINSLLSKGRVVSIEPPREIDPARLPLDNMLGDMVETLPPGLPVVTIEVDNDEAIGTGGVARGDWAGEAPVFYWSQDSGSGHFVKADAGNLMSQRMIFGNGWDANPLYWPFPETLTGYDALVYIDSANAIGTASFQLQLWDGDPLGVIDTTCSDPVAGPQPIPGTLGTFTDLPQAIEYCPPVLPGLEPTCVGLHRLRVTFPAPLPIECDRAWATLTGTEGCRFAWRVSAGEYWDAYPEVGSGDALEFTWSCEQFGACPTGSGYGVGTCCDTGDPCDFSDADPANWTGDCVHETYCGDGQADSFTVLSNEYPIPVNFVGSAWAPTNHVFSLVPVSADAPPEQSPTAHGWSIEGNEILLNDDGHTIWLEIRISDLDPDGSDPYLKAWLATVDSAGYASGLSGTLTPYSMECLEDAECIPVLGVGATCKSPSTCEDAGLSCSQCAELGMPCMCTPGYIDLSRPDYMFYNDLALQGVDLTTTDFRYGASLLGMDIPAPDFESYAGTLVLRVPPGAEGIFTVGLRQFPDTSLVERHGLGGYIPLVGTGPPARITLPAPFVEAPQHEPMAVEKVRYLSFSPRGTIWPTALRVTFDDLPAPYDTWNGVIMWIGPPEEYCENSGQSEPPEEGCEPVPGQESDTFFASTLQCQPHYAYWGQFDVVHVFHEGIVPGAVYEIQSILSGDDIADEAMYSEPLELATSRWCDLVKDCTTNPCGAPDGSVDITTDVTALINKFKNLPSAPTQVRTDLLGSFITVFPDQQTTVLEFSYAVDAFLGFSYPFSPGMPPCTP